MDKIFSEIAKIESGIKEDLLVCYGEIATKSFSGKGEQRLGKEDTLHITELMRLPGTPKTENLCVLVQSAGGHIAEAIQIGTELRRHYKRINFVVMTYAGSAGAYLCLCGDTLYMRPNALLSDFGPQNWQSEELKTAEDFNKQTDIIMSLYQAIASQLAAGTMKCIISHIAEAIVELGGPCTSGVLPNGKIHGSPLAFGNLKQLIPENIKPHTDIPAPGTNIQYIADSFAKLNTLVRKEMRAKDIARLTAFQKNHVSIFFDREK